jgi:hypothetical protein
VSTYDLALLVLALGDKDRAFALFSKAYEDHSSFLPFIPSTRGSTVFGRTPASTSLCGG